MMPGTEELRRRANETRRQADCLEAAASLRELADEAQRHSHYATQLDVAKEVLDKLADLVDERTKLSHCDYLRVLVVWMREKARQSERDAMTSPDDLAPGGDALLDDEPESAASLLSLSIAATAPEMATIREAIALRWELLEIPPQNQRVGETLAAICDYWRKTMERQSTPTTAEPPAIAPVSLPPLVINPNEVCVRPSFGQPTIDAGVSLPALGPNGFREFSDKSAIKPAPFHPGRFFATGPNGEVIRDSEGSHNATTFPTEQAAAAAMLSRGWGRSSVGKVN